MKLDEKIALARNMQLGSCYLSNQEGGSQIVLGAARCWRLWPNEWGNNEERRKYISTCRHTTFEQNCALGNFEKGLKYDLPLVIHVSKLAKQR